MEKSKQKRLLMDELRFFVSEVKRVADDGMLTPQWAKYAKRMLERIDNETAII